ncbi:MAG: hypothetical protein JWN86_556 [Planctomycetota bacterium]|nr:hypothetical protein [Planctomycetota bacterium]
MDLRLSTAIVIVVALLAPSASRAEEMEVKFDGLARGLAATLMKRNETKIAIGEFSGAASLRASAGPAIAEALSEALAKHKIMGDDQASVEIRGEYFLKPDASGGTMALKVKFQVVDTNAGREKLAEPEVDLFSAATVARLTGVTGDLSGKTNRERLKKVEEGLKSPRVAIDKPAADSATTSRVSAPGHPYAVEVLVRGEDDFQPRPASAIRGFAFVPLKRDDVYAVRLLNDSPLDAAVELCIDGVNIFALHRDPLMRKARIIVPAGRAALIRGYAVGDEESREFLLAGVGTPVDGRLLPKGNLKIGTITAMFSAAWKLGDAPPRDEPEAFLTEPVDDNRTIPGTSIAEKIERVEVEIGKPRVQISIRYNKPAS